MALAIAMLAPLGSTFGQDESETEAFELSPFEVDASQDAGYRATNTLAGTRLNSSLRDTAASISVWTEKFLEDTGFAEIEELILYSTNTVIDTADAGGGDFFNTFTNAANVLQPVEEVDTASDLKAFGKGSEAFEFASRSETPELREKTRSPAPTMKAKLYRVIIRMK